MMMRGQILRAFSSATPAPAPVSRPTHVKRFYKKVDVIEHPMSDKLPKLGADEKVSLQNLQKSHDKYYAITLDGRVTKTLY